MNQIPVAGLAAMCLGLLAGCADPDASTYARFDYSPPESMAEASLGEASVGEPGAAAPQQRSAGPGSSESLPPEADLGDYLTHAALNSPELEAAFQRWMAASEVPRQRGTLPDPHLTYRYYIKEVETRVGAQRQSVALAQKFPWFGKLELAEAAAAEAARVARWQFEARKASLFYRVRRAWYDYYRLGRAIAITAENMELLRRFERVVRTRYKASAAGHPDLVRVQVELGKVEDRIKKLQALRAPVAAELQAAAGLSPFEPPPFPKEVETPSPAPSDQALAEMLRRRSPELKALDRRIASRQRQVALAEKQYYPDFTLGATYIDTNSSFGGMNPPDDGKDPLIAMVSVNIPLWRGKYDAAVREAKARRTEARLGRADKLHSLEARLKMALNHLHDAQRRIRLYEKGLLPKATQAVVVTEAAYRNGTATFLDLLDAERELLEFELTLADARAEAGRRMAEVEMLIGADVPVERNGTSDEDVETEDGEGAPALP